MHGFYGFGIFALLGFQQLAVATDPPQLPKLTKANVRKGADTEYIPGRFIVEFEDVGALTKRSRNGNPIEEFLKTLKKHGIVAKPKLNITSEFFNGASFTTSTSVTEEDIAALPDVKLVRQVRRIPLPPIIEASGMDDVTTATNWTSHANTGVLEMHKKGYLGEGVVVGVVDTGTDYTHPAFGGSMSGQNTVIGGKDFVGDEYEDYDYNNWWIPKPDNDPMDCFGHGTHVSGIIAGNDATFISVAPKAKIRSYKVFGCEGATGDDILVASFVQAQKDGCDIITASIGAAGGWPNDVWPIVASRIANNGVLITIAGGNEGAVGPWYAASGASARDIITVGSTANEQYHTSIVDVKIGETTRKIGYTNIEGQNFAVPGNKTLKIYTTSTDFMVADDACSPLPDDTPDLSDSLVIVRRGGCGYEQKQNNIVAKGAKFVWFVNPPNTLMGYTFYDNIKVKGYGQISFEDAAWLYDIMKGKKSDPSAIVDFTNGEPKGVANTAFGGKMSTYTSWGPTWEATIKSEIAAPGQYILSTYPLRLGKYRIISGTSMACPYVAGIAALYISKAGGRQKLGVKGIAELRNRIITSGTPINWSDGRSTDWTKIAPVAQQGAGYINAAKILSGTSWVSPAKLELNDTEHATLNHVVTFRNASPKAITISITHTAAATYNSFSSTSNSPSVFPPTFVNGSASVTIMPSRISVAPRGVAFFAVVIKPPANLDESLLPVYSGHIQIVTSAGETHTIPYLGIAGAMRSRSAWSPSGGPRFFDEKDLSFWQEGANFTMDAKTSDIPVVVYSNDFGTRHIRMDIVKKEWNENEFVYPPKKEGNYVGSMRSIFETMDGGAEYPFPRFHNYRHNPTQFQGSYSYIPWNGTLTDGTTVPPGSYRINARALRLNGDEENYDDWVSFLSPAFNVVEKPGN